MQGGRGRLIFEYAKVCVCARARARALQTFEYVGLGRAEAVGPVEERVADPALEHAVERQVCQRGGGEEQEGEIQRDGHGQGWARHRERERQWERERGRKDWEG